MGRKIEQARQEEGFTLIELLVVVIIIGILAAIAIPVFLNQRERAWTAEINSDLRNAGIAQETYYTDNGEYTATVDPDLTDNGFVPSPDTTITISIDADAAGTHAAGQGYCMTATHANGPTETYGSNGGLGSCT